MKLRKRVVKRRRMRKRKAKIGTNLKRKPNGTVVLLHLSNCHTHALPHVVLHSAILCLRDMHAASFTTPGPVEFCKVVLL